MIEYVCVLNKKFNKNKKKEIEIILLHKMTNIFSIKFYVM